MESSTARRLTVDGGKKIGPRRTDMKRRSGIIKRLDSSVDTKSRTITDYYSPRAPSKRKRMMNGEIEWEEEGEWTEVALSFPERSEVGTPSRVDYPTTQGTTTPLEAGTMWEDDDEWTSEALSFLERSETNTPIRGRLPSSLDVQYSTTTQLKWRGQRDSSEEERCAEPQLSGDEQVVLDTDHDVLDDDRARGEAGDDEQIRVDSLTTDVEALRISTRTEPAVLRSNGRGPQADLSGTRDINPGVRQEVIDDLDSNIPTTPLPQHPSMVEGSEDKGCSYTEGVCAVHGPATKKWRGGKTWGVKKNGLYGWKYTRRTYWICEKRPGGPVETTGPVGGPEPTFIYMGVSTGAKNLSNRTSTGGNGVGRVERFRDFEMSSQPAGRSRK